MPIGGSLHDQCHALFMLTEQIHTYRASILRYTRGRLGPQDQGQSSVLHTMNDSGAPTLYRGP